MSVANRFKFYSRITTELVADGGTHYLDHWVGHSRPTTVALLRTHEETLLNPVNYCLQQGDDADRLDFKYQEFETAINLSW